jgi:hypothetical protein
LAIVALQHLRLEQGNGSGMPHPERRRSVAAGVSGMRKAHGQDCADRGFACRIGVNVVEFRMIYEGRLPSNGSPTEKHTIRKVFHPQLLKLWDADPMLKEIKQRGVEILDPNRRRIEYHPAYFGDLAMKHRNGAFRFLPLVTKELDLVCILELLILRRENPGDLVKTGGDIDNRIKTLFDALRVPNRPDEIPAGISPAAGEDPFYCLLEDDSLIVDFKVSADRLLAPPPPGEAETNVHILLTVKIMPTVMTTGNIGFS